MRRNRRGCWACDSTPSKSDRRSPRQKPRSPMRSPAARATSTEENLQARVRGLLLMGLSNKFGEMLVTTGNKSEMSVGYATLYGDMCGGYSVLKDIYKTEVYALSRWRNENMPEGALGPAGRVIPESSITKAPTAELRPNQTDQDSLPPYDVLDGDSERARRRGAERGRDRRARVPARDRRAHAAPALHGGIQAPAGAARREDHAQEFRSRSPLSDHQRLPREQSLEWSTPSNAQRVKGSDARAVIVTSGRPARSSFSNTCRALEILSGARYPLRHVDLLNLRRHVVAKEECIDAFGRDQAITLASSEVHERRQ